MRIDQLRIQNFKCFDQQIFDFNPQFNMFVGGNGSGKSSVLDALAVAAGSWFLGISDCDTRHILPREVRLVSFDHGGTISFEAQFPSEIEATGSLQDGPLKWKRTLDRGGGRTTSRDAREIKQLGERCEQLVRANEDVVLPIISYYGTGRLWLEPKEVKKRESSKESLSRLHSYRRGVDSRVSSWDLLSWLQREDWLAYQERVDDTPNARVIKAAILSCIDDGKAIFYNAEREEVVVEIEGYGHQAFGNLSDGQRNVLAMVGDLAIKAAKLNPQFGDRALQETPGVVLIDELDLHLHPKWQRRIIEDLRRTFPKVQFFVTTHSPFLVQTLREGELRVVGPDVSTSYAGRGVEDVARHVMGVDMPETSPRYKEMIDVAKIYFSLLDQAEGADEKELMKLKKELDEMMVPYSDNPAYVAYLEMKRHAAGIDC